MSARPVRRRATLLQRFLVMAKVGVAMMFHDKLKMLGTLVGVVFAVVLSNQQAGTFFGLLFKNVMVVRNIEADIWVVNASTETLQAGRAVSDSALYQAKATPGVAWAEPLIYSTTTVQLPSGGSEPVTLIGTKYPRYAGRPWNLLAGSVDALSDPDTMIFEDSERETLGGLNLGSVREVGGHKVKVGGFTWGLIPFGPSFAFADFELAREITRLPQDQLGMVLVKLAPGADAKAVQADLARRVPDTKVLTSKELERSIVNNILFRSAIGITFGTTTLMGVIVGFVIVSLSMFSAVIDNIREFGTLKAVGATNFDLAMLLFVQSIVYGVLGSLVGLTLVSGMARGMHNPKLALVLPTPLTLGTIGVMVGICVMASVLALLRLRKVEPAMVFR